MLEVGIKAPDFTLADKDNNKVSLSDFTGKKVILYFYPKDSTPGCTQQALGYKDNYNEFKEKDIVIIGISKDPVSAHQKFVTKYELPFILLSDTNLDVIKKYDVWHEKKLYGKPYMGVVRSTYLIDENGLIIKASENVKPDSDANQMYCEL